MESEKKPLKNWSRKDSEITILIRLPNYPVWFYSSLLYKYQTVYSSLEQVFVPLLELSRRPKETIKNIDRKLSLQF